MQGAMMRNASPIININSKDSIDSFYKLTRVTNTTEESKIIIDLQASLQRLEQNQQNLLDYMCEFEDSIVILLKGDKDSKEMKKHANQQVNYRKR